VLWLDRWRVVSPEDRSHNACCGGETRVNPFPVTGWNEAAPCTACVKQLSDNCGSVDCLYGVTWQAMTSQNLQSVESLGTVMIISLIWLEADSLLVSVTPRILTVVTRTMPGIGRGSNAFRFFLLSMKMISLDLSLLSLGYWSVPNVQCCLPPLNV